MGSLPVDFLLLFPECGAIYLTAGGWLTRELISIAIRMEWWQAVVLGMVQGLTEFLPISSTAHLRIVPSLLGWADPGAAFSAVIQLGTLAAVFIFFSRSIWRLSAAALRSLWNAEARRSTDARLAWAIAAANIPIVVLGLGFRDFIENEARSLYVIGAMLITLALLLMLAEQIARHVRTMQTLRFWQIQVIGLFQALALIPGASRSGSTILGGLLLGLRREDAARFSFLLGIPAVLGSGLFQLKAMTEPGVAGDWPMMAIGLVAALVSGYASIGYLLRFLRSHSTLAFSLYRIALGALVLALAWQGSIR